MDSPRVYIHIMYIQSKLHTYIRIRYFVCFKCIYIYQGLRPCVLRTSTRISLVGNHYFFNLLVASIHFEKVLLCGKFIKMMLQFKDVLGYRTRYLTIFCKIEF